MFTLNVILTISVLLVLLVGWYSIHKETFFTEYFEYYIEKHSMFATVLQTVNYSLLMILFWFGGSKVSLFGTSWLITAYLIVSVLTFLAVAFFFLPIRAKLKKE